MVRCRSTSAKIVICRKKLGVCNCPSLGFINSGFSFGLQRSRVGLANSFLLKKVCKAFNNIHFITFGWIGSSILGAHCHRHHLPTQDSHCWHLAWYCELFSTWRILNPSFHRAMMTLCWLWLYQNKQLEVVRLKLFIWVFLKYYT